MTVLSQRDQKWSTFKLGTSDVTIGGYGCTITSLAMYIGTTPNIVNEQLKQVGGFANGNLVIWDKVKEAFPGVEITKVSREWNSEEVSQNTPCIVEVDFDGTDRVDNRHFVLYLGNDQMADPWTGTTDPVTKYRPLSYRLIKGTWSEVSHPDYYRELDLTNKESMKVAVDVWFRLKNGELVEKGQFQTQADAATQCQSQLTTALEQVELFQNQANEYKISSEDFQKKYESEKSTVIDLQGQLEKILKQDKDYGVEALEAQHKLAEIEKNLRMLGEETGIHYDTSNGKALVEEVLKEMAEKERQIKQAPQQTQLEVIIKLLKDLGIDDYLQLKGLPPILQGNTDPALEEKVAKYLADVKEELIALAESEKTGDSPVLQSLKKPRKSILSLVIRALFGWALVSEVNK